MIRPRPNPALRPSAVWSASLRGLVAASLAVGVAPAVDLDALPTNTWVEMHPTYVGAPDGGELWPQAWNNKGAYDPASGRVLVYDRWGDAVRKGSIYANALLAYDPALDVVTALKLTNYTVVSGIPCASCYATVPLPAQADDPTPVDRHPLGDLALAPDFGRVFLGPGLNQTASYAEDFGEPVSNTWSFDLRSGRWSLVSNERSPAPVPPGNPAYGLMCYDPVAHLVVYLLGRSDGPGAVTWLLDPATGAWRSPPQDPSATGVSPFGSGVTYDPRRGRIVVCGGGWDSATASSRLWAYSVADNRWTRLADCPVPAAAPGFDYDSSHDVFLALVGTQTWIYDPGADAWTGIDTPMPRIADMSAQPVVYDAAHDVFVFEGGNSGYAPAQWILFRYAGAPAAPTVIRQPQDVAVASGADATVVVVAAGTPAPTYRWQRRPPGATGFADLPAATAASCTLAALRHADSGTGVRCLIANSQGTVTSAVATITVDDDAGTTGGGTTGGTTTGGTTTGDGTSTGGGTTGGASGHGGTHRCGSGVALAGVALLSFLVRRREARS